MNKRGNVTIYIAAFIMAVVIIVIAAALAPLGIAFNTQMYLAGQDIINKTNSSISGISDSNVRASVQGNLESAMSSAENNITVNSNIFQYSWIAVIGLTVVVLFIYTRRLIEYGGGIA